MSTTFGSWTRMALVAAAVAVGTAALGEDLAAVKARMLQRRDAVQALVAKQAVGESNRGLLAARGKLTAAESSLLAAENEDRKLVYAQIAAKTGASLEQVGRQRAAAIAERAAAGSWLQDEAGNWKQKP